MGLWDEAAAALESGFSELKAVTGSYAFAAGSTISISLWEGQREASSLGGEADVESHHVVWFIPIGQLVVSDVQKKPRRGDRITVAGVIYEILPIRDGEPSWQYSGVSGNLFRVQTRKQS